MQPSQEDTISLEKIIESLKVLLSPYLQKNEKLQLLQTIQKLFDEHSETKDSYFIQLISDAKEVFTDFSSLFQVYSQEQQQAKITKASEGYKECTFKPQTNWSALNEKLARRKYKKDGDGKQSRVVFLYLDGLKKDKVKMEVKKEDEKYKGTQECTFKP